MTGGSTLLWGFFAPILMAMPRISAAIMVAPLFPTSLFPALLRSAVAVSLSLYLYPHMAASLPAQMPLLVCLGLIGKEVFIGSLLGVGVGTLIWAFESAGALIDFQVGFSNAQVYDPFGGHEAGPLSVLMMRIGVVLFLAGGGLQVLTSLLFESFHLWPVTSFYPSAKRLGSFAGGSVGSLADLIVHLAAPAVLLLALIDVGFGLVGRVVPQLNVFFFTMPIKGALAALMIAVYLSYMSDTVTSHIAGLQGWLERSGLVLSAH